MPDEKLSIQDFAAKIKAQYPEYEAYDDTVLVDAMLQKYPVYKAQVDYNPKKKEPTDSESLDGQSQLQTAEPEIKNPWYDSFKESVKSWDKATSAAIYQSGIMNVPVLSELVAGSNRIASGLLDYVDGTFRELSVMMAPDNPLTYSIKKAYEQDGSSVLGETDLSRIADYYDKSSNDIMNKRYESAGISQEDLEKGITGLALDGDFTKSAFLLFSGATQAIPSVALAATTGLTTVSLSAAGNKYREIKDNPAYSPTEKLLFMNAAGLVEGLSERMGGRDLADFRRILSNPAAANQYRNAFITTAKESNLYKELLKSGLEEGFEEALVTSYDQMVTSIKEGKAIEINKIIDDFLVGFVPGAGTSVVANGMSARGSLKNEQARREYAEKIEKLKERAANDAAESASINDFINKEAINLRALIEKDMDFFSNFSKEDQERVRSIDQELNKLAQESKIIGDAETNIERQTRAKELIDEKNIIESKYRDARTNAIMDAATPEQLKNLSNLEVMLDKKKKILENGSYNQGARDVIQKQADGIKAQIDQLTKEILGDKKFEGEPEPTPVTIELDPKVPQKFEDLTSGRVVMKTPKGKTVSGRLVDEGGGKISLTTDDNQIIEIGNIKDLVGKDAADLGLAKAEDIVSIDGNEITVSGDGLNQRDPQKFINNYSDPLAAINRDENGIIQSVTLDTPEGNKRTFRGNIGDEIAYNIIMSQFESDQELEKELENLAKQDEETDTELTPTPEAEVAPAPETTPDTEQAPEVQPEPEVEPEVEPEPAPETEAEVTPEEEVKPAFTSYVEKIEYFKKNPDSRLTIEGPVFPKSYGLDMNITIDQFPNGRYEVTNSYQVSRKGQFFGSSTMTAPDFSLDLTGLPFEEALNAAFSNIENAIFRKQNPVYTEKEIAKIIDIATDWIQSTIDENGVTGAQPEPAAQQVDNTDMITRFAGNDDMTSGNPNVQWRNEEDFYSQVNRGTGMSDEFRKQVAIAAVINNARRDQAIINGKKPTSNNELVNKPLDSIERFRTVGKQGKVEYFTGREMTPGSGWKAVYGMPLASKIVDIDDVLSKAGLKKEEAPEVKPTSKGKEKPQTEKKSIPSNQDIIDAETGTPLSLKKDSDIKKMQDIVKFGAAVVIESDKEGAGKKKFFKESNPKTKYGVVGPGYQLNTIPAVKKEIIDFVKKYNAQINSMDPEVRPTDLLIDSKKKAFDAIKSFIREKANAIGVNKILFDSVTIDGTSKVLTFTDAIKQMSDEEFKKLRDFTEATAESDNVIAGVKITDEEAKRAKGFIPSEKDRKNFFDSMPGDEFTVPNKEWWEVAKKIMNLGSNVSVRLDIYEGGYDKNPKRKRTKDAPKRLMLSGSDEGKAKSVKDILNFKYKGLKGIEAIDALEQDLFFNLPNPWIEQVGTKGKLVKFNPATVGQVQWSDIGMYGFDKITRARAFDALSKGKGAKKLVMDGYDQDSFSDYATESLLPEEIKALKQEGLDVEKQFIAAVAKAFDETQDNVAKVLGFSPVTEEQEITKIQVKYNVKDSDEVNVAPSGSTSKIKTQKVNTKEMGPIEFTAGDIGKQKESDIAKLKQGAVTIQERIINKNETFSLTGNEKIRTFADVAYLLRHLETAASENLFLTIHNENGDYKVLWLATGAPTSVSFDKNLMYPFVEDAISALGGSKFKIGFIHNHPSGSLGASDPDINSVRTVEKMFSSDSRIESVQGIIINLDSGKYLEFNSKSSQSKVDVAKPENEVSVPVYSFSRKEIYVDNPDDFKARNNSDTAKILSKIKVKPSGKIGHVVLDNSLNVTHVAFVDEKITGVNWAKMINIDVGRHGAGVVLFGSNSDHINKMKTLTSALYKIGGPQVFMQPSQFDLGISGADLITDFNQQYVILNEADPEFREKQGYKPLTDDELDYPSRMQQLLQLINRSVWSNLQKEIMRIDEIRSAKTTIEMRKFNKLIKELRDSAKKTKDFDKAKSLIGRYLTESNKESVVDAILELKNGENLLTNVRAVRSYYDHLTKQFLSDPSFDALPESLKEQMAKNVGVYLHRSYRFFDDPVYRIGKKERNRAVNADFMIRYANWIDRLVNEAGYSRERAIESTLVKNKDGVSKRDLLIQEAKESIDRSIESYTDMMKRVKTQRAQGKGANIPNSAFMERKDIPAHIRELLGEIKDPFGQMISTADVLVNIYQKGKMVEMLAGSVTSGIKDIYAKEEYGKEYKDLSPQEKIEITKRANKEPMIKDNKDIQEREKATYKQVNDPYSPLNKKWLHKDIAEVLQAKPIYEGTEWYSKIYFFILKNSRMVKILPNSPTWVKNVLGTLYFNIANGAITSPKMLADYIKNAKDLAVGLLTDDSKYSDMLEEMAENGVLGQDFSANQIAISGFTYYVTASGDQSFYNKYVGVVNKKLKQTISILGTAYAGIDDFGKMSIYMNEKKIFAKKLYGAEYDSLTPQQQNKVKAAAAERVKQNTPTFSRLTKVGRAAQRAPIGDFQGFRFEAFRSTYAIAKNAIEDIKKGYTDKTLSSEQKKAYYKDAMAKMVGLGIMAKAAPYAVIKTVSYGAGVLSMLGIGGDDNEPSAEIKEAAEVVRPGWLKDRMIWVKSIDKNLNVRVYDYTGFDPYAEVFSVVSGRFGVLNDMLHPDMAINGLVAMGRNQDVYGRQIADPSDPAFEQILSYGKYGASMFSVPLISSSVRDAKKKKEQIRIAKNQLKLQGLDPKNFPLEEVDVVAESVKLIAERMFVRDYEYNLVQQFKFSAKNLKSSFGDNYLTDKYPEHRKAILDDVRNMLISVTRVAVDRGNTEAYPSMERFIKQTFDTYEASYILDPSQDYSDVFPKGYFESK